MASCVGGNKKKTNKREACVTACGLLTHLGNVVVVVVVVVVGVPVGAPVVGVPVGAPVAGVGAVGAPVGVPVVGAGVLHCIPHLSLASWTH